MATEMRDQILANCRFLIKSTSGGVNELDIVTVGTNGEYMAAAMCGMTPAIEGPTANTPDLAIRKLYLSTCELLAGYIPKLGAHQRNIHGGGIFDEDFIKPELTGVGEGADFAVKKA